MNKKIGTVSSIINICAVAGFALSMPFGFLFGAYFSSVCIALSFIPMVCSFAAKGNSERRTAGYTAMIFAGIYAAINLLVYFTQLTTVRFGGLSEQAARLLDFQNFGLIFNFDMLGYCAMSLATFFAGMTIDAKAKSDRALKWMLMAHGIFAISCLMIPLLGVFNTDMQGVAWIGTAVLEFWCIYFIPIGVLSFRHFKRNP
ncbi:hypothetical protein LQZ18_01910 [Lachnospiraceae bacterium ZAX-1]